MNKDGVFGRTLYNKEVVWIVEALKLCEGCCFEKERPTTCRPGLLLDCGKRREEKTIMFVRDLNAYKVVRVTHALTNGKLT